MTTREYHSNGKLLLTGEYLVLKGAKALALPLKYGQDLKVSPWQKSGEILWKTYVKNKLWFEASFDQDLNIIDATLSHVAKNIQKILKASLRMSGLEGKAITGKQVTNHIHFDIEWGFGSSSSLLSNIGYWLKVNPFQLQFETSNGSGYDVAAARSEHPIVYSLKVDKPIVEKASFNPSFKDCIYFVYLGKKQRSEESVQNFKQQTIRDKDVVSVSALTTEALKAQSLFDFEKIIREHNRILSAILKRDLPGKALFASFEGEIKPLGAWGGDFIMATSAKGEDYVKKYFSERNFNPVFTYDELVK